MTLHHAPRWPGTAMRAAAGCHWRGCASTDSHNTIAAALRGWRPGRMMATSLIRPIRRWITTTATACRQRSRTVAYDRPTIGWQQTVEEPGQCRPPIEERSRPEVLFVRAAYCLGKGLTEQPAAIIDKVKPKSQTAYRPPRTALC